MGQRPLQQRLLDPFQRTVGDLGSSTRRAAAAQRRRPCGLPASMPAVGALPGDIQLAGDLGLGATLGRQFGGAFPAGLAGGAVR